MDPAPKANPQPPASVFQLEQVTPLTDPKLREIADATLMARTPKNAELDVLEARYAIDSDLMGSPGFTARKKLILAEVLRLVADSMDPARASDLDQRAMLTRKQNLRWAVDAGVGQMLARMRPMEQLTHQLQLWKANSRNPKASNLATNQMTLVIGPNLLVKKPFQKVVEHEMKQYNGKIANGLYRSFMLLPLDSLRGGKTALLDYLRMAAALRFHVIGSVGMREGLDEMNRLKGDWQFRLNDVTDSEQAILSNASIVGNDVVIRDAYPQYDETTPLECGLQYALAAQMAKYFQRKKDGHWYIPLLHPKKASAALRTVNIVANRIEDQHAAVTNRINLAYTVSKQEDPNEAGVKIYGVVTTFPEDQIPLKELGNRAIPLIHSQARVTKNRIEFFLLTQLERYFGGSVEESEVEGLITRYLNNMKLQGQIDGFQGLKCKKEKTGKFSISVSVGWAAGAREFEIDLEKGQEQA